MGHVFNIDNGYLEGLCRGFKNGILRQADYLNLVQCETLEGKTYKMTVSSFLLLFTIENSNIQQLLL